MHARSHQDSALCYCCFCCCCGGGGVAEGVGVRASIVCMALMCAWFARVLRSFHELGTHYSSTRTTWSLSLSLCSTLGLWCTFYACTFGEVLLPNSQPCPFVAASLPESEWQMNGGWGFLCTLYISPACGGYTFASAGSVHAICGAYGNYVRVMYRHPLPVVPPTPSHPFFITQQPRTHLHSHSHAVRYTPRIITHNMRSSNYVHIYGSISGDDVVLIHTLNCACTCR